MNALHIDIETRSPLALKKIGAWHYLSAPETDVLCVAFSEAEGPARGWTTADDRCPALVRSAIAESWPLHSFGPFDRLGWELILAPRYGWPIPKLEQWHCTMTAALYLALPGQLDRLGQALDLGSKDAVGVRLMLSMTKPRKPRAGEDPNRIHWNDGPEHLARLVDYCKHDVLLEREISQLIPPLPPAERELWLLDQRINDRGFFLDYELALGARTIAAKARPALNAAIARATGGAVTSVQQTARLRTWLEAQGL
jgi:DNA polymerase bacteriophage-type